MQQTLSPTQAPLRFVDLFAGGGGASAGFELATAQGFPASYKITGTKAEQIARIGNSVPPPVVEKLVAANFPDHS